ncbi:MAG TPA: glycosyltransferase family 2 protein [Xanthobacteraceae bacterium]|nr:glycosyltransferase family 2 protein [Xanthobacteraceae bacterium]
MTPGVPAINERPPSSVCLCVPTFRRPAGLRKLLEHIERLSYSELQSVIVVDNDAETRAGATVAEEMARQFRIPLVCRVEPQRGHTYAYNNAFVAACRAVPAPDFVAVLDDDEFPDPNWLTEMVRVALRYNVDIVGGPVFPVFDLPDHWLAKSGLYAPTRYETGPVPMIYGAGSMLIRRATLEQYLDEPFLHEFAFTGGGDEEFFHRCRRDGRSFAWADEAHVFETVPPSRITTGYLLRRKFRSGGGATRVERELFGAILGAPRRFFKAASLLGLGILSLPIAALRGRTAIMRSLFLTARGSGRIAAELGILYEEYR